MTTIGFIGLGTMGAPMAANLLRNGYRLTVYNRTPDRADELLRLGANAAASPRQAAEAADVVITMISNDDAIEQVYYGEDGVFAGLKPGMTAIDSSTISPALARRLAADAAARGVDFLDAPVTGSKPQAIEGALFFLVGGKRKAVDNVRGILLAMGRDLIHLGDSGSGATAKLANNTIVGINAAALIEGMSIAVKGGIDADAFLRLIQAGGAASRIADMKGRKMIDADYDTQFALGLMLKDLRLSSVLSDGMGVPTPLLEAAKSLYQTGQAAGYGDLDVAALARVYEQWIGRSLGGGTAGGGGSD